MHSAALLTLRTARFPRLFPWPGPCTPGTHHADKARGGCMARRCLLVGVMLLAGRSVQAQVPAGFEVVVNTNTAGYESAATVEMDASGHFVVGWAVYDGIQ